MIAIQKWFLRKNGYDANGIESLMKKDLTIERETEKAVLIRECKMWVPKSCLTAEWETKKDSYDYHDYLVEVVKKEYANGNLGEKEMIRSGKNQYSKFAFIHQKSTKEITNLLNRYNVEYMTKDQYTK